jgi:hypothetical protein
MQRFLGAAAMLALVELLGCSKSDPMPAPQRAASAAAPMRHAPASPASTTQEAEPMACHSPQVLATLSDLIEKSVAEYGMEGQAVGEQRARQLFRLSQPSFESIYVEALDRDTGALQCVADMRFPMRNLNAGRFIVPKRADEAFWDLGPVRYVVRPTSMGDQFLVQVDPEYGAAIGLEVLVGILDKDVPPRRQAS